MLVHKYQRPWTVFLITSRMKLLGYGLCFLSIMAVAVIASNNTDSDLSLVASRQSGTSSAAKLRRSLNLNKRRQKIPALSAIVFQRNRILLNYNSGYANIRDKVKLRGNHPFLLASISKIVTATALLQLYERGEFKLNEPVDKYLDFDVKHPRFRGRSITFKMLLTHTSSIDDNSDVMNKHYFDNKDSTMLLEDFLYYYFTPGQRYYNRWDNFRNKRPGTEYWYSNWLHHMMFLRADLNESLTIHSPTTLMVVCDLQQEICSCF